MDSDSLSIDGVGPMPVERPASVAELCDIVRRCAASGTAIYPVGGGTLLDYGTPPAGPGVALSTARLDQVIDFPARDMTLTVQAGITIAKLQEIAKTEGLWLPIDVPDPDRATLGGSIAANVSGPRRYGYGTFRDYVIGITVVNDRGEETKAGGRVVKNVAGYDLPKLYTGSLGTLGVITQVTLKLKPVPEERAVVVLGCNRGHIGAGHLGPILDRLHQTRTRPVAIDLLNARGAEAVSLGGQQSWTIAVAFEGTRDAVSWQASCLCQELKDLGIDEPSVIDDSAAGNFLRALADGPSLADQVMVVRANVVPSFVAFYCENCLAGLADLVHAHAGSGIVTSRFAAHWRTEELKGMIRVGPDSSPNGSNQVVRLCPTAWKKEVDIWGSPPANLALQKAVKHALDPTGLFNPGRFVTDVG